MGFHIGRLDRRRIELCNCAMITVGNNTIENASMILLTILRVRILCYVYTFPEVKKQ